MASLSDSKAGSRGIGDFLRTRRHSAIRTGTCSFFQNGKLGGICWIIRSAPRVTALSTMVRCALTCATDQAPGRGADRQVLGEMASVAAKRFAPERLIGSRRRSDLSLGIP